ncbi:hypothetical protein [Deinococcus aerolatus]|uniref:hypothetical protein n=1 Tax=Deinococcus aerolatus TaxID=522487 RepID=UPI001665A252|nr:hypothetical protein [Deinococcus aerolatus]
MIRATRARCRELTAALAATGHTDHTLKLWPRPGHSLGPAADLTRDGFAAMAAGPRNDMAAWLRAKARTRTGTLTRRVWQVS